MIRHLHLAVVIALAAQALPARGQEAYGEQDPRWSDEAPPPPPDADADDADRSGVDVSVDMATPGASVTFDTFHDGLQPYGEWTTVPGYGSVWRPHGVAADWRPYSYGRWEWTNEGWLWVSDEPWGWAAYHYGRWAFEPAYGWLWVPGYQWAPAWVTWRYSPEYIGWAPLAPGFSVFVTSYPVHYRWWSFVPCNRFVGFSVHSVAFTGDRVQSIFHATQPAPPRAVVYGAHAPAWGGPARPFVEHSIGRPIAPVRLQPVGSPGVMAGASHAGVVPIYRPDVRPGRPAPAPMPGRPAASAPARPWGAGAPAAAGPGQPRPGSGSAQGWRSGPQAPPSYAPRPAPQQQAAPRYVPQQAPRYAPQQQATPRYAPRYPPQQARPGYAPQVAPRTAPTSAQRSSGPAPGPGGGQFHGAPQGGQPHFGGGGGGGGHGGGGGGGGHAPAPHRR